MAIELMNAIWKLELEPSVKFVFITLADCCDHEGKCFPSLKFISRRTGYSISNVQRSLRSLIKMNFLVKEDQQRKNGSTTVNLYQIRNVLPIHLEGNFYINPEQLLNPPPLVTVTTPPSHHDYPYNHHLDPPYETKDLKLLSEKSSDDKIVPVDNFVPFEEFREKYPRKEKMGPKSRARRIWNQLQPSRELFSVMCLAIGAQIKKRRGQAAINRNGWVEDWPMSETWLSNERWTDEVFDPEAEKVKAQKERYAKMAKEIDEEDAREKLNGHARYGH